jgi:O-antigen/teichoic acid export membrane protein
MTRLPRSDLRELFWQSAVYLPSRVVPALLTVISLPILARILGPEQFGVFSLVTVAVAYATPMLGDWVVAGYQREAQLGGREVEGAAVGWSVSIATLGSAVLGLAGWWLGIDLFVYLSVLVPPTVVLRIQLAKLQMFGQSKRYSQNQVIYSVLKSIAVVVACIVWRNVGPMVAAWAVSLVVVIAVGPRLAISLRHRVIMLKRFMALGAPLVLVSLALNGLATADRFILAWLRPESDVGVYSVAYMLADGTVMLLASLPALAIYPQVASLWDGGERARATHLVRRAVRLQSAGLAAVSILAASVIVPFLTTLLGEDYSRSSLLYVVVGSANMLAAAAQLLAFKPTLEKSTVNLGALYACVAILNIPLTIVAVIWAGAMGAAAATAVTYVILLLALSTRIWPELLDARDLGVMVAMALLCGGYGAFLWLATTGTWLWLYCALVACAFLTLILRHVWVQDRLNAVTP